MKLGASSATWRAELAIIASARPSSDGPDKCEVLASQFGTGANQMQVRLASLKKQLKKENWMQYLDALEGLRSQGFLNEPITTKRYEYVQRFIESVRDAAL